MGNSRDTITVPKSLLRKMEDSLEEIVEHHRGKLNL